jgi:hypothetical protein
MSPSALSHYRAAMQRSYDAAVRAALLALAAALAWLAARAHRTATTRSPA